MRSMQWHDGCWGIKTNQEINDILKGQNTIGFIKKQRLNWLGHVEGMAEDNIVQKIKRWKRMSKRPIGRPKTRWEDDVLEDIKSINISSWKKVAQNRDRWKKVVEQVRTLYRLQRFIRRKQRMYGHNAKIHEVSYTQSLVWCSLCGTN